MNDLSFLRLEPIFNDAKYTRASSASSIFFLGQIILKPNETYLQTTNTKLGIAFDGNYRVSIVDCNDVELLDITSKVAINERTIDGVQQIDFEIVNIGVDFYAKNVYLKFVHTVSDYVWWSNAVNITNYFDTTCSRFDYKNATDTYFQSITLKCFFSVNDDDSNSSEYTTQYGKKVTSRLINTELEQYFFEKLDNFTFRRLNNLLRKDVIYINGNRDTIKLTLPSTGRTSDTNVFNIDFKLPIDYNDTFDSSLQIFEPFGLLSFVPSGIYTLSNIGDEITGSFNRDLVLGIGTLTLYKDNVLFQTFTQADIVIIGNTFTIDITGLIVANGEYYINFTDGLFISIFGEVYPAITNTTDWTFTIANGEFSNTDFNNEFLIN